MKWERDGQDWPNRRASRFVASGAHVWHVQRMGRGPTILLIHGAGASTHSWRDVLPDLARDHDVIAVDLPGQGFSTLGSRARCSLEAMAKDLAGLLKSLKARPAALVGHSAGAPIMLRMALESAATPKAIVCLNGVFSPFCGVAGFMFPMTARLLAMNPFAGLAMSQMALHESGVRALISSTGSKLDDPGVDLYRRLIGDPAHMDATIAMMARWDVDPLLREVDGIDIPTLLVAGAQDTVTPPWISRDFALRLTSATVQVAPGFGHLYHEEAPAEAAEAIRAHLRAAIDAEGEDRSEAAAAG